MQRRWAAADKKGTGEITARVSAAKRLNTQKKVAQHFRMRASRRVEAGVSESLRGQTKVTAPTSSHGSMALREVLFGTLPVS